MSLDLDEEDWIGLMDRLLPESLPKVREGRSATRGDRKIDLGDRLARIGWSINVFFHKLCGAGVLENRSGQMAVLLVPEDHARRIVKLVLQQPGDRMPGYKP